MRQIGLYFVVMVLGLTMAAGPVLAAVEGMEERPLKTAVHSYDPERPYWVKVLPDEKMPYSVGQN